MIGFFKRIFSWFSRKGGKGMSKNSDKNANAGRQKGENNNKNLSEKEKIEFLRNRISELKGDLKKTKQELEEKEKKLKAFKEKSKKYEASIKSIYNSVNEDFKELIEPLQFIMGYARAMEAGYEFSEGEKKYSYNERIIEPLEKMESEYTETYRKLLASLKDSFDLYTAEETDFMQIMLPLFRDLLPCIINFLEDKEIVKCAKGISEVFEKNQVDVIYYDEHNKNHDCRFEKAGENTIPVPIFTIGGKLENWFSPIGWYR